jgi:hypothetical protein
MIKQLFHPFSLFRRAVQRPKEAGQSIVIIAFVMVGLLGVVGLAVDVGFVFARRAQLSAAVDAAVLASVTELAGPGGLASANTKAAQFLSGNNIPTPVITATFDNNANFAHSLSEIGATEYSLTVTWPVDLFFLRLVGWESVDIQKSATAAFFPLTDVYASRRVEEGALTTSNQAVFGPHICTSYGDPYSPLTGINNTVPNPYWPRYEGTYNYRILIPASYPDDIVRVELFDPDSMNQAGTGVDQQVAHSQNYIDPDGDTDPDNPPVSTLSCTGSGTNQKHPCMIPTGETSVVGTYGHTIDDINLFWFFRIDENRGEGNAPGNGNCNNGGGYVIGYNTATLYELYYYRVDPGGTATRVELASYTGQTGDARDGGTPGDHLTDLRWVTPGAPQAYDFPAGVTVPTNCGSYTGGDYDPVTCPGGSAAGAGKGFEISLSQHLVDIVTDPGNGNRYLYMDVTSLSGASENGYEIWAGPNSYLDRFSADVNVRNVQIVNKAPSTGVHTSQGATVFGIGRLPMNSNYANDVAIPLVWIGPEYAGSTVWVSLFDPDSGAQPPIVFFFDSIRFTPDTSSNQINEAETDWAIAFGVSGVPDPDGGTGRCTIGTTCNNNWVTPAYRIDVPTLTADCDYSDPDPQICTPFYGGRLSAYYQGGGQDTYGWEITMSGLPFLVK